MSPYSHVFQVWTPIRPHHIGENALAALHNTPRFSLRTAALWLNFHFDALWRMR